MSPDRTHTTSVPGPPAGEGALAWILPLLMLVLVTLSGFAITQGWDGENAWRFTLIAFVSGALSALLAKSRILDGFAIAVSMIAGVATVWIVTALFSGHIEGTSQEQIRGYLRPLADALYLNEVTGSNRELTAETLLSLTIWMSSWIAMWMLLRVGYATLALLAPTVLILANQQFSGEESLVAIVGLIGLGLIIIVGQRYTRNRATWNHRSVPVADSILGRVFISGLVISIIVSSLVMASPQAWSQTVVQPLIERTVDRLQGIQLDAQSWFDDVLGTDTAPPQAGSYTDFSDGFQIGGPLSLTDQPEVLVQTDALTAPYLKARSYDNYTGRGWSSSSSGEFAEEPNGVRITQELRYNPGWEVALSGDARNQREAVTLRVSPLTPNTDIVYSVDSFVSADTQTVVRMSWRTVDDSPLALSINSLNQLPPDVQRLGSLLLQSELTGKPSVWGPGATSDSLQAAIDAEVEALARRGIEVRWSASPEGIVETLYISGRLPVFDDVEAVFRYQTSDLISPNYRTTGLTSVASPDQLAAAGTEYPVWVTDRYLQTGDTITDRTVQLTEEIVAGESNPYGQAILIEQWLRTNITYDDTVDAPPGNQDLVDYVLFDYRNGYCEHYAAAMTVMLRSQGIPARVVVGYAPGEVDDDAGGFVYRQRNAHAWVEAYFPGYGWVPFEPTANRPLGEFDLDTTGAGLEDSSSLEETVEPTEEVEPTADIATPDTSVDNSEATPLPTSEDQSQGPPVVLETGGSEGFPTWALITATVGIGAAAAIGAVWLLWHWNLRGLLPAAGLMRRLQRLGSWLGIRSSATTTPREYAKRFESSSPGISVPVKRITKAYEIETYGPRVARDQVMADAKEAWSIIKRNWWRLFRRK